MNNNSNISTMLVNNNNSIFVNHFNIININSINNNININNNNNNMNNSIHSASRLCHPMTTKLFLDLK